jgi:hypothetical protein
VVLTVSYAGDASGRSSARELRGLLPSRGRAFTLPALMTSGVRLRIKEAQRLTLRSGEAVNAVAAWPVPADRRRPSRGEAGRDGAARARVTWVSQGGGSGSGITAGGSIALVPARQQAGD